MEVPPDFDWRMYLELNEDITKYPHYTTQTGAISHWKQYGRKEGRPYKRTQVKRLISTPVPTPEPEIFVETKTINDISINEKNKIVVFTCISGNYENLKEINNIEPNIDYICFTNNKKITSKRWEIRNIPDYLNELDEVRKARCIKVLPHIFLPEYDVSLWIDGNIEIKGNLTEFINEHIEKSNFLTTKHPDRICVYDESVAVLKLKKDDESIVNKQMDKYRRQLYPEKYGMVQTNVILRKHNEKEIIKICNEWWNEILKHSKRDQLSFNYVCWKNQDVNVEIINPTIILSKYFNPYYHTGKLDTLRPEYGNIINYFNGKEV